MACYAVASQTLISVSLHELGCTHQSLGGAKASAHFVKPLLDDLCQVHVSACSQLGADASRADHIQAVAS